MLDVQKRPKPPSLPSSPALARRGAAPRYRQVQEDLERQIARGAIHEGESLPSEEALCRLYGVSRITVRKALDGLRAAQFIESRKGSGSYVIRPPRMFRGWLHDVISGSWDARLFVSDRWVDPPGFVRDELRLAAGEQVKIWETVLLDKDRPYVHTEYHLPAAAGERVRREDIEQSRSVTRAVEDRMDVHVARAIQTMDPALASANVAHHLQIPENAAVLRMVRTYFARDGQPLHVAVAHAHPELYRYTVELLARP